MAVGIQQILAVLDTVEFGVLAIDHKDRVLICNRVAGGFLGLESADVLGKVVQDVIPHSQLPQVRLDGETQHNQKFCLGEKWFMVNRAAVRYRGGLTGAVVWFQDISEVERVSQELDTVQAINRELNAIIDSSYDAICVTNGDGDIISLNPAFERLTGLSREQYYGINLKEMVDKGIIDTSATLQAIEQRQPVTVIQQFYNGRKTINTGIPIMDDAGNVARVLVNMRDITELNRLKTELEHSKERAVRLESELSDLRYRQGLEEEIVALSRDMQETLELARRVALVDSTVLLLGESGVGKDLVAKLIHWESARSQTGSFIKLNCGAIPRELLESELFGYDGGAFSGAKKAGKAGYFELAHGGTLFLDEVAELPPELQVKLLRVLQDREVTRLGATKPRRVDARIIAATNRNLRERVSQGLFREDLFYRLNVVPIEISPLRQRGEDIPALLLHFLKRFNVKYRQEKSLDRITMELMTDYAWPGNVRELANMVERMVVTTAGARIGPEALPAYIRGEAYPVIQDDTAQAAGDAAGFQSINSVLEHTEKQLIELALDKYGTTRKAAKALGMSQSTFSRRVRKYLLGNRQETG